MNIVRTQISFEAAHRLYDVATYSEECRTCLHGHSYKVAVECFCDKLNDAGMVVDFKLLKKIIRETIEDKYDHSCILRECDPLKDAIVKESGNVHVVKENPTAEWMAELFAAMIDDALAANGLNSIHVQRLEVQETENNIAVWSRDWTAQFERTSSDVDHLTYEVEAVPI